MQNMITYEVHDFILKSCKEAIHDFSYRNDQMTARDASIIEKYFFEHANICELSDEFQITASNVDVIINRYLAHLSAVADHGGYTSGEIDVISTLLEARRSTRRAFRKCVEAIAQCKNGSQNELIFNISDPVEKLYKLNLISIRTRNCLRAEFEWDWDQRDWGHSKVTVADIIYVPKMWFRCIVNMGEKSIAEIVEFMNNYQIQGRIIPTKEDIKRVLKNANTGITIADDGSDIISAYYLTDMSVDAMCERLQISLDHIQKLIEWYLGRVCESYCKDGCLLDLITISSMLDLWSVRRGNYEPRGYCINEIANRIRELCHSKE